VYVEVKWISLTLHSAIINLCCIATIVCIVATILGLGKQISEIHAQRKFVSAMCHAHSNAHKPPKSAAPTVLMLE